jgi:hypothetical protein
MIAIYSFFTIRIVQQHSPSRAASTAPSSRAAQLIERRRSAVATVLFVLFGTRAWTTATRMETTSDKDDDDVDEDDGSHRFITAMEQRGPIMGYTYPTAAEARFCWIEDLIVAKPLMT